MKVSMNGCDCVEERVVKHVEFGEQKHENQNEEKNTTIESRMPRCVMSYPQSRPVPLIFPIMKLRPLPLCLQLRPSAVFAIEHSTRGLSPG